MRKKEKGDESSVVRQRHARITLAPRLPDVFPPFFKRLVSPLGVFCMSFAFLTAKISLSFSAVRAPVSHDVSAPPLPSPTPSLSGMYVCRR